MMRISEDDANVFLEGASLNVAEMLNYLKSIPSNGGIIVKGFKSRIRISCSVFRQLQIVLRSKVKRLKV